MEELDVVRGTEFRGRSRTALKISQGRLDEPGLATLSAVKHFENEVRGALVDDDATLADISW